ncbi:hypothetical protein WJX84_006951 [Apatococcus fuscideae]|uniref:Uncharacterized protein n=1 Tax=Apatococcus fuscideae TaxID=2026836 RepID=A0AAW1TBR0_9CHLO
MWWKKKGADSNNKEPQPSTAGASASASAAEERSAEASNQFSQTGQSDAASLSKGTERIEPSSPAAVFEFGGVVPAGTLSMQGVCNVGPPSSLQPCIWLVEPTSDEDSKAGQQKFHIEF